MRHIRTYVLGATFGALVSIETAVASECWQLRNVRGQSAFSGEQFRFSEDGFKNPMILCFEGDRGSVSGTDIPLVQFGDSTLAGGVENNGFRVFEVYQIDRARRKVLFAKTRVDVGSEVPVFGSMTGAFVGDATPIEK
jgi:hypothetical protein